jgi:iron complex transport system permease protein
VSGGAAASAAFAAALGFGSDARLLTLCAFAGAVLSTCFVLLLGREHGDLDVARLLMSGLILNSFCSALILLALAFARGGDLAAALRWMMGSLTGVSWQQVSVLAVVTVIGGAVFMVIANDLRMMAYGEEDARSHGVPVDRLKLIAFGAAALITAASVAVTGVIGFVGLMVPHMVRAITQRDFRVILPFSMIGGAILLVSADALARSIAPPLELPVGALLALIGVPFFIRLLRSR